MNTNSQIPQYKKENWLIPLFMIAIVLIWFLFPWALSYLAKWFEWNIQNPEDPNFGTFGDTYGALNTLFSGLAFATLIITLILQRKELQLQRKAVQDQQIEIQKSNDIAEHQVLITEQQADLLEKQIQKAQVQNFFNVLFPLFNRKKAYYEEADKLPVFGPSSQLENIKSESTFKTLHFGAVRTYENFEKTYGSDFLQKDEIVRILKKMIQGSQYLLSYSYLKGSKYKEYFLYIINFIENFEGIDDKDRDLALSIFISDFSTRELYIISLLTIEDDVLLDKVIKHKIFDSFIKNDRDGRSIFSLLYSE
ncbi:hypothetical protein [Acinetobacter colistiniresistens]|uniref:Phage abortive infection protein n=1 Tax=Acinetobacter colistiniresistens TaxID=280145 RepID=A0A558FD59_9GAMM|nr:hypothetical protein [Acinetobacter colistiniresistens]TVT83440.1 hypothetical protein FPV60_07730 [Acinetobacter colistiniresistens]